MSETLAMRPAQVDPAGVCSCHADGWDIDGLTCPQHEDDDPDAGCREQGHLSGAITCDGCDFRGSWL